MNIKLIVSYPNFDFQPLLSAVNNESENEIIFQDDSKLRWEKTTESFDYLDTLKNELIENDSKTAILFGFLFLRYKEFFEGLNDFNIEFLVIHQSFNSFKNSFDNDLKTLRYFTIDEYEKYPTYDYKIENSTLDYLEAFYYNIENKLTEIEGVHVDELDLKNERIVKTTLYRFFFEDFDQENSLYESLEMSPSSHNSSNLNLSFVHSDKEKSKDYDTFDLLFVSFLLPEELELFGDQVNQLSKSLDKCEGNINLTFRVHLDLSEFYTEWEKSKLDQEILYSKFYEYSDRLSNYGKTNFTCYEAVHGCNDIRRETIREYGDKVDGFMWMDPDTVFSDDIFEVYESILPRVNRNYNLFAITPEIYKPETGYLEPLSTNGDFPYEKLNFSNIYRLNKDNRHLNRLENDYRVNGAGSVMSSDLLKLTGIPVELGHYGNDDIYVNECINIFNNRVSTSKIALFKIKNLVVYQDENWKEKSSSHCFVHKKINEDTSKRENHEKTQSILDELFNKFKAKISKI